MSRVSSRTLRHYDHVGLLPPAHTGHGGMRYYERPQLLRLQHILVLRELGLGLDDIGAVLRGETDEVAALRRHHARLLTEADRLRTLADTVASTIDETRGRRTRDGGREAVRRASATTPTPRRRASATARSAVEAQRRAASWDDDRARGVAGEGEAVHRDMAAAMAAGTAGRRPGRAGDRGPPPRLGRATSGRPAATPTSGWASSTSTTSGSPPRSTAGRRRAVGVPARRDGGLRPGRGVLSPEPGRPGVAGPRARDEQVGAVRGCARRPRRSARPPPHPGRRGRAGSLPNSTCRATSRAIRACGSRVAEPHLVQLGADLAATARRSSSR